MIRRGAREEDVGGDRKGVRVEEPKSPFDQNRLGNEKTVLNF